MAEVNGAIVVKPGEGLRVGNVEFFARSEDTPRFNLSVVDFKPGRLLDQHVHDDEDDSFYILEGEVTFLLGEEEVVAGPGTFVLIPPGVRHGFRNDTDTVARILNVHAPAGFDLRIRGDG